MSIMKTIFSFGNNKKSRKTHSSRMRFQPQLEPLEDRQLLAVASLQTVEGMLDQSNEYGYVQMNLHVGATGNAPVLGIRVDATTAGFNPSAISVLNPDGTNLPADSVKLSNPDYGGTSSSLLLVQLSPGDYFIRVGGDKSTYGSFTCDVYLPGDIHGNGTVTSHTVDIANAAYLASNGMLNHVGMAALEKQGITLKHITEFTIINEGITFTDLAAIKTNSEAGEVTVSLNTLDLDQDGPEINADLAKKFTDSDGMRYTGDSVITGTVTDKSNIKSFEASFDGGTTWTNIPWNTNGSFTIDANVMKTMSGSPFDNPADTITTGIYTIRFRAEDEHGNVSEYSFEYEIIDDTAPVAKNHPWGEELKANDTKDVKDNLKDLGLVSHDYENLGNILTFVAVTNSTLPSGATVSINANGDFVYTPGDGFKSLREGNQAEDSFEYTVKDVLGRESAGTIMFIITGVNSNPYPKSAIPDQTTDQNTEKTIDVLPYFDDWNVGDVLSLKSASVPTGSVTISAEGEIVFHPGNDFQYLPLGESQTVEITFVITDDAPTPLTVNGSVKIVVTGLNDAPVANHVPKAGDASLTTHKNGTIALTVADTGSTDPDQGETETLVYGWIGRGTQGKDLVHGAETRIDFTEGDYVIVGADGKTLTYYPGTRFANNGVGNDKPAEFEYQVRDVHGALSNKATISLTVLGVNDPPVIDDSAPVEVSGGKKGDISIPLSDLMNLASDPNGDQFSISRFEFSDGVNVMLDAANDCVIYNPGSTYLSLTNGQTATDTFKFWVKDEHGAESLVFGTVKVTINGSNDPPEIHDQTLTLTSSGTGVATCMVATVGFSDSYAFEIVGTPGGGPGGTMPGFIIDDSGVISVDKGQLPATTGAGEEYVLTIRVRDTQTGESDEANITIRVVEKNPPVISGPTTMTTTEKEAKSGVEIIGVTNGDDDFVFEATLAFKSFTFGGSTYNSPSVTANGKTWDISGFSASVTNTETNQGTVSFNPNGKFDFLNVGKDGVLTLEYTVKDKQSGVSAVGTIVITITGVNDPPVAVDVNATTDQNTVKTLNEATNDVMALANDPDNAASELTMTIVTQPSKGEARLSSDGKYIVFDPKDAFKSLPLGQSENVTFTYTIRDPGGLTSTSKTVTMTVTGLNDAPEANNYTAPEINRNQTSAITVANTGSTDPDTGETAGLVYGWVGRGTQGQNITVGTTTTRIDFTEGDFVIVSADGKTLTYNPGTRYKDNGAGTNATATFEYQVKDNPLADATKALMSNKATISILVKGIDNPPEILEQIDDQIKTMGTFVEINLLEHFGGNNLAFSFEKGPDQSQMLNVTLTGNILRITFLDNYNSSNNRIPVSITVTATNAAGTASVSQSFQAAAIPQTTLEVVAVPVPLTESNRYSATDTYKTPDERKANLEVNVGDRYYLEIWVSDTLFQTGGDYADFSRGMASMYFSLRYDPSVARIVGNPQFSLEGDPDDFDDYFVFKRNGTIDHENGLISGLGAAKSPDFADLVLGANGTSLKLVRILVEAVGVGNPNFEFVRPENYDDWEQDEFYFSRLARQGAGDGFNISNDQIETFGPSITHVGPAPLLAAETPEKIVTGGVYPRVATTPTTTSGNGTVAVIPENADWIHEWQTHWVELWVKASEVAYFLDGTCDLNYNTNYFTAVEVELSPAFRGNSNPVIHDALGKVTGIGGNATQLVSGDGYVLLGRVKFQSIGTDNVPFAEAWFAHDLGISLENVKVTTSAKEVLSFAGKSPRTELWAVPYDTTDSGRIDAIDYTQFLSAFVDSREQSSYLLSFLDFNKDGKVDAKDYTFFLAAFGITRDSGVPVPFPQSFTQRYVGKKLDADSAATVNKIIDAANKAWQTALGLDRPVEIQIVVQDFGAGNDQLATAQITAVDAKGLPLKGIITLDSTAAGMGWYSQIGEPVANGRYDLFTVLLHEMGHIYGFNTSYDAFNAVVGQYIGQLDKSGLHAADPNDLMYATLATGIRKYISTFDVAIITSAYDAANADPKLGFSNSTAALSTTAFPTATLSSAALSVEAFSVNASQPDLIALVVQENGSFVTTLNTPVLAFAAPQNPMVDTDTALRLHALGLAVAMPLPMQQREENRFSFAVEQIYNDETSFFDLSDDDLMTLHPPQDVDEAELALMIGLAMDLDA